MFSACMTTASLPSRSSTLPLRTELAITFTKGRLRSQFKRRSRLNSGESSMAFWESVASLTRFRFGRQVRQRHRKALKSSHVAAFAVVERRKARGSPAIPDRPRADQGGDPVVVRRSGLYGSRAGLLAGI